MTLSLKSRESILKVRLIKIKSMIPNIAKCSDNDIKDILKKYYDDVMKIIKDDMAFDKWCKEVFGISSGIDFFKTFQNELGDLSVKDVLYIQNLVEGSALNILQKKLGDKLQVIPYKITKEELEGKII